MSENKNLVNLNTLANKAKINDIDFIHYENSKAKINTIIRKNKLPDFIVEYLWQSKIYKKEIIKYQKITPTIRSDVIENCTKISSSPWPAIFVNFIKYHNPTLEELHNFLFVDNVTNMSILLDCWDLKPEMCIQLEAQKALYLAIYSYTLSRNEHDLRRIIRIISFIISKTPTIRFELLDEIIKLSDFVIIRLLEPALKSIQIDDDVVDYLLKNINKNTFKKLTKIAIHRMNVSESMAAKIYLYVD